MAPTETAKKRYELELKNTWIGKISWKTILQSFNPYSGDSRDQCTEALQQGLRGHEYFEEKDISFGAKCLLKQIKVTTQGIKEENHSYLYNYVCKLIRQF